MNQSVSKWTEEEEREYVIDLLKRRDILQFHDNSILKMCFRKSRKKRQTKEDWIRYLKIIDSYIRDKNIIKWRDGKFEVHEK